MANSVDPVDPDQTAPSEAVWSGSALFAHTILLGTLVYKILGHLSYVDKQRLFKSDCMDVDWFCWELTTRQSLWVILCLSEKGRKETEHMVKEKKEWEWEERGFLTGMKVKKQRTVCVGV